jgi:hypothetical protein
VENEEPKLFWSYGSGSSRGAFGKESPRKETDSKSSCDLYGSKMREKVARGSH